MNDDVPGGAQRPPTAFERYIASGRASGRERPGLWRVFVGLGIIAVAWVAGTAGVLFLWTAYTARATGDPDFAQQRLASALDGNDAEVVAVLLATFAGIWIGVFVAVRLVHHQRFATLFAPDGGMRLGDLGKGLLVALVFALGSSAIGASISEPVATAVPLSAWLAVLLPVIGLVFLQATAEELIFRGYLLQQLALRSRNPLLWAALPSAIFGALHWAGDLPGAAAAYYVLTTFFMGLALATLVWRTGALWASIGLHVGFNVFGLTVIGAEGLLSGAQLFLFDSAEMEALLRVDLLTAAALALFVLGPLAPFGPPRGPASG